MTTFSDVLVEVDRDDRVAIASHLFPEIVRQMAAQYHGRIPIGEAVDVTIQLTDSLLVKLYKGANDAE